jgi:hypothetical protein
LEESKDDDDLFFAPVAPFGELRAAANAAANAAGPLFSGIAGGAAAFAPFGEPRAAANAAACPNEKGNFFNTSGDNDMGDSNDDELEERGDGRGLKTIDDRLVSWGGSLYGRNAPAGGGAILGTLNTVARPSPLFFIVNFNLLKTGDSLELVGRLYV